MPRHSEQGFWQRQPSNASLAAAYDAPSGQPNQLPLPISQGGYGSAHALTFPVGTLESFLASVLILLHFGLSVSMPIKLLLHTPSF